MCCVWPALFESGLNLLCQRICVKLLANFIACNKPTVDLDSKKSTPTCMTKEQQKLMQVCGPIFFVCIIHNNTN